MSPANVSLSLSLSLALILSLICIQIKECITLYALAADQACMAKWCERGCRWLSALSGAY